MVKESVADRSLADLISWNSGNEPDSYPYFRDFFCDILGYPKNKVKLNETGVKGYPDISLYAKDSNENIGPWVVGEIKPENGFFRNENNRDDVWRKQLKRYISADTVYALLLDPITIVILGPNGERVGDVIELEKTNVTGLRDKNASGSIAFIDFESSLGPLALNRFISGLTSVGHIDVTSQEGREAFYTALRLSAAELRSYAINRISQHFADYDEYKDKITALEKSSLSGDSPKVAEKKIELKADYREAVQLREDIIPYFEAQMGREVPENEKQGLDFIKRVYATESANLVLARILFVRFFEDYGITTRKISNGGIKAFRDFNQYVKDDYRLLLDIAFRDLKPYYARLFEESIFDWAQSGNGQLSKILLRIFYRMNAFDFKSISGDILGNLYERFLDPKSRKEMGEFYTPEFIVTYILKAIGFTEQPGPILDPACGSGTFLFKAMEQAIQYFLNKGIPYKDAIEQSIRIVHGLDVNVFAAFIAQLQVIWHLFPHLQKAGLTNIPPLNIYGGVDSLESPQKQDLDSSFVTPHEEDAKRIRDSSYLYVVGNPPYIRAERIKTSNRWDKHYSVVATGKKDISFYFLYRSLEGGNNGIVPWLQEKGVMGFIVPFGIADSKSALSLRKIMIKNNILEIVDLESLSNEVFTSGIATSRGTVAPLIFIVGRGKSATTKQIKITVATRENCIGIDEIDLKKAESSKVSKELFSDTTLNPFELFITKIRNEDIDLLRKIFSHRKNLTHFAASSGLEVKSTDNRRARMKRKTKSEKPAIQVGIQTGTGSGKIFLKTGSGRFPMARGSHLHTFVLNEGEISEYVALNRVDSKSIWRLKSLVGRTAYAINEVGYAPQACIFNTGSIVAQKSCIVFVPKKEYSSFPWDVYLNSRITRFLFGLVLRSALIEGNEELWRATINSEAIKILPVSEDLIKREADLIPISDKLRTLAKTILARWKTIDQRITKSRKTTIALLPIRYINVDNYKKFASMNSSLEITSNSARIKPIKGNDKQPQSLEGDEDALRVIHYMMKHSEFALEPSPGESIPEDYKEISKLIKEAEVSRNPDILEFKNTLEKAEKIIAESFGLTHDESAYLKSRLETPPFRTMQPRWPWVSAEIRPTRIYEDDRFA